jgi:hypothetical protein
VQSTTFWLKPPKLRGKKTGRTKRGERKQEEQNNKILVKKKESN